MPVPRIVVGTVILGLTSGCAATGVPAGPEPSVYAGPLHLAPDELKTETDRETGAAGRIVSCRTRITGDRDDPDRLHEGAPAATPQKALRVAYGEGSVPTATDDFVLERQDSDRALFTYRVDGVVKQALIMHHGPTQDRGGKIGWYLETRARCDWAELPEDVERFYPGDLEFWTGPDGLRAPTYDVISYPGPEHCDWQAMTFLHLGTMPDLVSYVSRPDPDLADWFAEPYQRDVVVPGDAIDTGYSRQGRQLWLSADRQRAYVGRSDHAELWPITARPLGCA